MLVTRGGADSSSTFKLGDHSSANVRFPVVYFPGLTFRSRPKPPVCLAPKHAVRRAGAVAPKQTLPPRALSKVQAIPPACSRRLRSWGRATTRTQPAQKISVISLASVTRRCGSDGLTLSRPS